MRLVNLLKLMCMLVVVALVYIHMQMRIIDLAYDGKKKENQVRHLIEENGSLTYAILSLKSSRNLGKRLLSESNGMQFVDPSNVLQISAPSKIYTIDDVERRMATEETSHALLDILSFGTEAEAGGRD